MRPRKIEAIAHKSGIAPKNKSLLVLFFRKERLPYAFVFTLSTLASADSSGFVSVADGSERRGIVAQLLGGVLQDRQFMHQPGACLNPVAPYRALVRAQRFRGFLIAVAGEEATFHHTRQPQVEHGQPA